MSKVKKIRYILTAALLALTVGLAARLPFYRAAAAPAEVDVRLLFAPQTETQYTFLDTPTSIGATATELYITTAQAIRSFSFRGAETGGLDIAADKAYRHEGMTVTLERGVLQVYFGDAQTTIASGLDDFSAHGSTLYAYANDALMNAADVSVYAISENTLTDEHTHRLADTSITALAAADGQAYVSIRANGTGTRDNICLLTADGTLRVCAANVPAVRAMTVSGDMLYAVSENKITAYRSVIGALIPVETLAVADVTDLVAADGYLYALTGAYAVLKTPATLSGYTELIASASAQVGFYDMPSTCITRKDKAIVADCNNHRVALVSDDGVSYLDYPFVYPTGVAVDDYGRMYVCHRINIIDVFDETGAHLYTVEAESRILDVFTDSADDVFVRTENGIGRLQNNQVQPLYTGAVEAAAVMPEGSSIYLYASGTVSHLENGVPVKVASIGGTVIDFAVDVERSIYVLDDSGMIRKYAAANNYATPSAPVQYVGYPVTDGARRLNISSIRNTLLDYGDLIVTDTKAHTVKAIDAACFAVKVIDENVQPPVDPDSPVPAPITDDSIVFYAQEDIAVYQLPRDMSPFYTIAKGRKIIVPRYNLTDTDAFSFVLVEDAENKVLLSGYVRKFRLPESARLPYVAPPSAVGTVQNDDTVVYKWPSVYAAPISGYDSLSKGTEVSLLRFVAGFIDDSGFRWYRVAVDGGEGYIYAANLSINRYQPVFERPQYNAEIVAALGRDTAQLYILDGDGNYRELENEPPLPKGTRVQVVGTFDPSLQYTQIKYFDETLGTLDCYVLTEHLKYHGVTALQIIVFVLIGVVLVLLIILIIHRFVVRRKKLTKL